MVESHLTYRTFLPSCWENTTMIRNWSRGAVLATAAFALCTTSAFSEPQGASGINNNTQSSPGVRDRGLYDHLKKHDFDGRTDLTVKFVGPNGAALVDLQVVAVRANGTRVNPAFDNGLYVFNNVGAKMTLSFAEKGVDAIPMAMPAAYKAYATIYVDAPANITKVLSLKGIGDTATKVAPGPVLNDLCADATSITDGATVYSTVGATTDGAGNGASCQFDGQTYHDIWFTYTATCTGDLTVSTCDAADYDPDVVIYDGTDCGALVLLGCADDTPGCGGFTNEQTVPVVSGNGYLIRVGGFSDGDQGSGTLTLTCVGDGGPGGDNNTCDGAIEIFDGATPYDTTGATTDGAGLGAACDFDGQTYHDIWFTYTATCTGTLTVSTCGTASYDPDVVIYDGTDCGALVLLGCDDDTPGCPDFSNEQDVPVVLGNGYIIRVGGWSDGDFGAGTLTLTCTGDGGPGGDNNLCADAEPITSGCHPFDTTGATTDGPGDASCEFDGQTYHDIWYVYTADCTGELTVSTCGMADYDTDLVIYDGTDCNSLVLLGCDDDTAGCDGFTTELTVNVVSGNGYLIRVGGFSDGDQGSGTLCIDCTVPPDPPANDNCDDHIGLAANDTVTFDNTEATQDDFNACGDNAGGVLANVWYSVVGTGNTMSVSTCNAGTLVSDTRLSVFCGECSELSCVDGNDDNGCVGGQQFASGLSWCSAPGVTYLISVGTFSDATAKGIIQLDVSDDGVACGLPDGACVPIGACCLPGGDCVVTTEADCGNQGGEYQGDDVSCGGGGENVADGSFEAGGAWAEASTNFGTPLCTLGGCGAGGGTGPNSGDWWAWFGGIAAPETGSVSQAITIPAGAGDLTFWLEIPVASGNGSDFLDVSIDGDVLLSISEADGPFVGYQQVMIPVGAYADGGVHALSFDSTISGSPDITNFFVDDVSLLGESESICIECFVIDFETEDDFSTPLGNGQAITTPPEFGNLISLSTTGQAQNENEGLSIFDTSNPGPNSATDDPDLLVNLGNALIIQETNFDAMTGDFFDTPNDERFGGTIYIDFLEPAIPVSVDLIDIDAFPGDQTATVTLIDGGGLTRTYDVPTGWTTDISVSGGAGYGTLDLATLAPQPGDSSVATASEDAGFDGNDVVSMTVFLTSSGAIDNLQFCQ